MFTMLVQIFDLNQHGYFFLDGIITYILKEYSVIGCADYRFSRRRIS
jgi:hypothetical protein